MNIQDAARSLAGVGLCLLLLAGCAGSPKSAFAPTSSLEGGSASHSQPPWETQGYEDDCLSYEIPASWQKHENSIDEMRLALFTPQEPASETPSNVSVQVLSLQNQSKDFDYSDPDIQKLYYEFLTSPDGGLPEDAQDWEYWTEQMDGTWVYSIRFARQAQDGTMVQQTGYFPMGLDYSLVVWATDYQDGCAPSADEIAVHICQTLRILNT